MHHPLLSAHALCYYVHMHTIGTGDYVATL
jgi:hypothetical protein